MRNTILRNDHGAFCTTNNTQIEDIDNMAKELSKKFFDTFPDIDVFDLKTIFMLAMNFTCSIKQLEENSTTFMTEQPDECNRKLLERNSLGQISHNREINDRAFEISKQFFMEFPDVDLSDLKNMLLLGMNHAATMTMLSEVKTKSGPSIDDNV